MKTCLWLILACFIGLQAAKPALAVLDLHSKGLPAQEGEVLAERLRTEMLRSKKYLVVERQQMQAILQEQGFQQSGCTSENCEVQMGQLIGVDVLLAGSVSKVQDVYYLSVRLLDVESGSVLRSADDMHSPNLKDAMAMAVPRLVASLTGTDPPPSPQALGTQAGDTLVVKDASQLLTAIRSNAIIALEPGTYKLSGDLRIKNRFIRWGDSYDGLYPVIDGVENLTLTLRGSGKAEILIAPEYGWVMEFKNSRNITLKNLTFGHTTPGHCQGGVLRFIDSENLNLQGLDLFGSGTYGLELQNSSNVNMDSSVIRECTAGLMILSSASNVRFTECSFLDTREYELVQIEASSGVRFDGCLFKGNQGTTLFAIGNDNEDIAFSTCRLENNRARQFMASKGTFSMNSTAFSNNRFHDYSDAQLRQMKIEEP